MATPTAPTPPAPPSGPRVECPHCGAVATGQEAACQYCATPLPRPAAAAPPPMAPPPQMSGAYQQTYTAPPSYPMPMVGYIAPSSRSWGWLWGIILVTTILP